MTTPSIQKPFTTPFLADFVLTTDRLPFSDGELWSLDKELTEYEKAYLNPDIEKHLISKNELLISFGISKAEDSSLTLAEAQEVYELVLRDSSLGFIDRKVRKGQPLNRKDYEKLEFFNIARTLRALSAKKLAWGDIVPDFIRGVHRVLTQGLDIFEKYLPQFDVYKSGEWRGVDTVRVGEYVPAPHQYIPGGAAELTRYVTAGRSPTAIAVFHTALYALHPFVNGNKRVCRVLEHILLRLAELNAKNLYSTSYYYHTQKPRYYKYLLASLTRKNLTHFTSFTLEALALSIVSVAKTSVEAERAEFLERQNLPAAMKKIIRPLVKQREVQFKNLVRFNRGRVARQTLVNYLQQAVEAGAVVKRAAGRSTYYRLNTAAALEEPLARWTRFAQERLPYLPDGFKQSVLI